MNELNFDFEHFLSHAFTKFKYTFPNSVNAIFLRILNKNMEICTIDIWRRKTKRFFFFIFRCISVFNWKTNKNCEFIKRFNVNRTDMANIYSMNNRSEKKSLNENIKIVH